MSERRPGRRGPRKQPAERKDRLIQTRVAGHVEDVLKREAARRRLSVSHLIRNVLEDSFNLVDSVVTDVDHLVQDSVDLAQQVRRDLRDLRRPPGSRDPDGPKPAPSAHVQQETTAGRGADADGAQGGGPGADAVARTRDVPGEPASEPSPGPQRGPAPGGDSAPTGFSDVYAWNPVVMNRAAVCAQCHLQLLRGAQGHVGLTTMARSGPVFLCESCVRAL